MQTTPSFTSGYATPPSSRPESVQSVSEYSSGEPCSTVHCEDAVAEPAKASGKKRSRGDKDRVRRPMNAFMVWAKTERKQLSNENPSIHNAELSKILGNRWKNMSDEEKEPFQRQSEAIRAEHRQAHPGYKYQPKKRKSDAQEEEQMEQPAKRVSSSATGLNFCLQNQMPFDGASTGSISVCTSRSATPCTMGVAQGGHELERILADTYNQQTSSDSSMILNPAWPRVNPSLGSADTYNHQTSSDSSMILNPAWPRVNPSMGSAPQQNTFSGNLLLAQGYSNTTVPKLSHSSSDTPMSSAAQSPASSCCDQLIADIDLSHWENDEFMNYMASLPEAQHQNLMAKFLTDRFATDPVSAQAQVPHFGSNFQSGQFNTGLM